MEKYTPQLHNVSEAELLEAGKVVMKIIEAFTANFQNSQRDLAHMITDKFVLRSTPAKEGE